MKNYAKVGGKKGRPAYRTPSSFIARKTRRKLIKPNIAKRNMTIGDSNK
jgi:hypothetical protein